MATATYAEVLAAGRSALAAAEYLKHENDTLKAITHSLAEILDEGRKTDKSATKMVDAVRQDLRKLAEGFENVDDIRRTADVVYGVERVNASKREAEEIMAMLNFIAGR